MKYKENETILLLLVIALIIQVADCWYTQRHHESRTYRRSRGSDSSDSSSSDSSGSDSSDSSSSDSSDSRSGESHSRKRYRDSWEHQRGDRGSRERDRGDRDYWEREQWDRDARDRGRTERDRWSPDSQNRYDYREREAWNPFPQSPDKFPSTIVTHPPARKPFPPFPSRTTDIPAQTITLGPKSDGPLDYDDSFGQHPSQNPTGTDPKKPFPLFTRNVQVDQVPGTKTASYTGQNDLFR